MHSPESTTSGLGIALRGGNGVVLPLRAWARASVYLLVRYLKESGPIPYPIQDTGEPGRGQAHRYDRIFFIAFPVDYQGSKRIRL